MRQCRGDDLRPGWRLADHDADIHADQYIYGDSFCHSNANQDTCFSNPYIDCPLSNAKHTSFPSDSVAALANAWLGGADDRDRRRQRGGSASDGFAPAGRGAGTNIKSQPTRLITG